MSNNIILFKNIKLMGFIPYKNYNCSILKLNSNYIKKLTNYEFNNNGLLVSFFVSSPGKRFGTMTWIGILDYNNIIDLLNNNKDKNINNIWIIKPHLLQNDKGPKCADLRLFNLKNNICAIGYTRLAPLSNTPNIADYYVRTFILEYKINNNLFCDSETLYHFNEIDGGCFPSNIGNMYKKFKIEKSNINNTTNTNNNIEYYVKNNNNSKLIKPHKSKAKLMPNKLKLNGIEVSFSKSDSNEDDLTHISTKNIVPLQHKIFIDTIGCFVDFTPPNCNLSLITIQNINNAEVYYVDNIIIPDNYNCKNWRGSTPIIELDNNMWITILHKRIKNNNYKYQIKYDYYIVLFDNKYVNINKSSNDNSANNKYILSIPNNCIYETKLDLDINQDNINKTKLDFIYITGLIIINMNIFNNIINLELLLSYGISDEKSGISKLLVSCEL